MNKNKTLPYIYFLAFIIALSLLTFTTVVGARAVLSGESEIQTTELQMHTINVAIEEKSSDSWKTIASGPNTTGSAYSNLASSSMEVGKSYGNEFRVLNDGDIDEYVRVVIYKYWTTDGKTKDFSGDESLIELSIPENSGWLLDQDNSTNEKTILFYSKILAKDESSSTFLNGLSLNGDIKKEYKLIKKTPVVEGDTTYYSYVYDFAYNGKQFKVEIEADAVQTHHAVDAIKSAWGRDVTISGGTITKLGE